VQLQIATRNMGLAATRRQTAERRLGFALARFGDRVQRVKVSLQDVKGP
jgi:hypothetical protein